MVSAPPPAGLRPAQARRRSAAQPDKIILARADPRLPPGFRIAVSRAGLM